MNRECCVCGGCAPSNKQWHNRDDGYAVCSRCFLESVTKIGWLQSVDYYGVPGIHHSIGSEGIWDAAPELLDACKYALELIKVGRQYFPKSMHDRNKFDLENTNAAIGKAVYKAEGVSK